MIPASSRATSSVSERKPSLWSRTRKSAPIASANAVPSAIFCFLYSAGVSRGWPRSPGVSATIVADAPSSTSFASVGPAVRSMSPICAPMASTVLVTTVSSLQATEYDAAHVVLLEQQEHDQHGQRADHQAAITITPSRQPGAMAPGGW